MERLVPNSSIRSRKPIDASERPKNLGGVRAVKLTQSDIFSTIGPRWNGVPGKWPGLGTLTPFIVATPSRSRWQN